MLHRTHILASAALAIAGLLPFSADAVEYTLPDLSDGWLQLEHDGAPWGGVGCQGFGGTVCDVPAGGPYKLIDLSDGGRALMRGINVAGGASSEPAEPMLPTVGPTVATAECFYDDTTFATPMIEDPYYCKVTCPTGVAISAELSTYRSIAGNREEAFVRYGTEGLGRSSVSVFALGFPRLGEFESLSLFATVICM